VKVFCSVFIVYLVVLLTQPCPDLAAMVRDKDNGDVVATHVDSTTPADCDEEECSPFCICSCCSHPVANHQFSFGMTTEVKTLAVAKIAAEYNNPNLKAFHNSVWQPPKA
jgi:hypothetical protein